MIFYFSGTGNCLDAARRLAELTGDEYRDIALCRKSGEYDFRIHDGGSAGFVFPVYYGGIPLPVVDFVKKLNADESRYVYIVAVYGGSVGGADAQFKKLLSSKNMPLDAVFGLLTPDNFLPMFNPGSEEKNAGILDKAHAELEIIAEKIVHTQKTRLLSRAGGRAYFALAYPLYKKGGKTAKFRVGEDCVSCGLCERICPENAVALENGTPVWKKERCAFCLGCINRCPVRAIEYGKSTVGRNRYVNPVLR